MRIGVDDTDSPRGGCTTWVATELARAARDRGIDLIGEPRLVRLNPTIPWKTRGNAALALRLGRGRGRPSIVGDVEGRPMLAFPRGDELAASDRERFYEEAWQLVRRLAPREPGTDPALVAVAGRLPEQLYWSAVRELVRPSAVEATIRGLGARFRLRASHRGVVGAAAAVAWPARRYTFELIAYRRSERIGTRREVDRASVAAAQAADPDLFLCIDPTTRRLLVAPHTDCPILFGLRATTRLAPLRALPRIVSEPIDRWMLFRTNQATGDHLVRRTVAELVGYRSGRLEGGIARPPEVIVGGHVRLELRDDRGVRLPCLAFEPTKTLPRVARQLRPGDRVRVWGSRGRSGALHLEGLEIVRLTPAGRWRAPLCRSCGRRAGSLGTGRGWRCPGCRARLPMEAGRWAPSARPLAVGTYHPTPSARRHLAPLAP